MPSKAGITDCRVPECDRKTVPRCGTRNRKCSTAEQFFRRRRSGSTWEKEEEERAPRPSETIEEERIAIFRPLSRRGYLDPAPNFFTGKSARDALIIVSSA